MTHGSNNQSALPNILGNYLPVWEEKKSLKGVATKGFIRNLNLCSFYNVLVFLGEIASKEWTCAGTQNRAYFFQPASEMHAFLLLFAVEMKHHRLAHLIDLLHKGGLSRNRNFDAHLDPEVVDARARHLRLTAIAELLTNDQNLLSVNLEPLKSGSVWLLKLYAGKWNFRWQAKLLEVEIDWLRNHPPVAMEMERLTSQQ